MKKIKVSFYILGVIVKNLSVLLCIGMLSACNATNRQPKENDDTEVFFSDKKVKEEDEEYDMDKYNSEEEDPYYWETYIEDDTVENDMDLYEDPIEDDTEKNMADFRK